MTIFLICIIAMLLTAVMILYRNLSNMGNTVRFLEMRLKLKELSNHNDIDQKLLAENHFLKDQLFKTRKFVRDIGELLVIPSMVLDPVDFFAGGDLPEMKFVMPSSVRVRDLLEGKV